MTNQHFRSGVDQPGLAFPIPPSPSGAASRTTGEFGLAAKLRTQNYQKWKSPFPRKIPKGRQRRLTEREFSLPRVDRAHKEADILVCAMGHRPSMERRLHSRIGHAYTYFDLREFDQGERMSRPGWAASVPIVLPAVIAVEAAPHARGIGFFTSRWYAIVTPLCVLVTVASPIRVQPSGHPR
jgi:hypothetical protein